MPLAQARLAPGAIARTTPQGPSSSPGRLGSSIAPIVLDELGQRLAEEALVRDRIGDGRGAVETERLGTHDEAGPESGIFRSADGGDHWQKASSGLPDGPLGRIGLDFAPSASGVAYAFVDNWSPSPVEDREITGGEVYRSDDHGVTWRKVNQEDLYEVFGVYGWKFTDVRVSPDNEDEIFILGGAEIYAQALPDVDRLELTIVHADVTGDTFFPECDLSEWTLLEDERHEADDRHEHAFSFRVYERLR